MNHERRHDLLALAILFLLPFALFADVLVGPKALHRGDFSAYNVPMKKILREIVSAGDFPWWNPYLSGGQPLAANAAHEVFYPLTWLILLPDFIRAVHLLVVVHLAIAACGMFALLRAMRASRSSAVIGGFAFACGGLLISALPTFAVLFSAAWIPWVCLFTRSFLTTGSRTAFAGAAVTLAMQLLIGEPTTVCQTGLLLVFYAGWKSSGLREESGGGRFSGLRRAAARVLLVAVTALLLASVQVIPLLDHFRATSRAKGLSFADVGARSTPPVRIAELVVPYPLGRLAPPWKDHWIAQLYPNTAPYFASIYISILLGITTLAGLLAGGRGRGLFLITASVGFLISAGDYTPLLRFLYDAGVASVVRYPEKFLIMVVFAAIVFAACTLDRMLSGDDQRLRKTIIAVAALVAAASALTAAIANSRALEAPFRFIFHIPPVPEQVRAVAWQHGLRAMAVVLLVIYLPRLRESTRALLLGAFVFIDLATVALPFAPRVDASYYEEPRVAQVLPRDRQSYRIFSLAEWSSKGRFASVYRIAHPDRIWVIRNEMLPLRPVTWDFRLALEDDFDRTYLARSTEFAAAAARLSNGKVPDWINTFAAMANVHYISVYRNPEQAIPEARGVVRAIEPVRFTGGPGAPRYYFSSSLVSIRSSDDFANHLRRRRFPRDVAFVEGEAFTPARGRVLRVHEWNNGARMDVETVGRAFLVMSVSAHRDWQIAIDGTPVQPVATNIAFQGVTVPPGRHVVTMRFESPAIKFGAAVSLATLAVLLLVVLRRPRAATMRAL
jgi:hypothetical protein